MKSNREILDDPGMENFVDTFRAEFGARITQIYTQVLCVVSFERGKEENIIRNIARRMDV